VCDVVYDVLLDRMTRQVLNAQLQFAIYDASGRYEMHDAAPTLEDAQRRLDEMLEAEPEFEDSTDRELLELMMGGA
jgi:hypothetical protein